jgi:hypothetical protein
VDFPGQGVGHKMDKELTGSVSVKPVTDLRQQAEFKRNDILHYIQPPLSARLRNRAG